MGMRAGIIGAGKVGFTLGKYFMTHQAGGIQVTGYYSRTPASAKEAAAFTETRFYEDLAGITKDSDTLFITVPDGAIADVWDDMAGLPIKEKIICHCSGSISSTVFFDAEKRGAYRYSVHPLYAISDQYRSYLSLGDAYFSIEGSEKHLRDLAKSFSAMGNHVVTMDPKKKAMYHAAAVMVSNQMVALADIGAEMLEDCGFQRRDAEMALAPLLTGNALRIGDVGPVAALTGPIERGDSATVKAHLSALEEEKWDEIREIYLALSRRLVKLAEEKHPERNFEELEKELRKK
jgi:predicted short-subunit dehydrogenase-like oxidoreductase (DUF2520 family)